MEQYPLKRHKLSHIPNLRVSQKLLDARYAHGCGFFNCDGRCCHDCEPYVGTDERDKILANKDIVIKHMETWQVRDSEEWFLKEECHDSDFPTGRYVVIKFKDGACPFLDGKGLCGLQKSAMLEGLPKYHLKPFFCGAFPITLDQGLLTIHDRQEKEDCCFKTPGGPRKAIDVCSEELELVLGAEGLEELRKIDRS